MEIGDKIECMECGLPFLVFRKINPLVCRECVAQQKAILKAEKQKANPRKKKSAWSIGMPAFSGRSWQELEDIWPRHIRLASEAHKIISGISPALFAMNQDLKKRGIKLRSDELWRLFWIQRCEEAKENVGTDTYTIGKPHRWNLKLYYLKQSPLMRQGLIEWFPPRPGPALKLVRVTALGKDILKTFIYYIEQAHRDVKQMVKDQPASGQERANRYLSTYCFNWTELEDL